MWYKFTTSITTWVAIDDKSRRLIIIAGVYSAAIRTPANHTAVRAPQTLWDCTVLRDALVPTFQVGIAGGHRTSETFVLPLTWFNKYTHNQHVRVMVEPWSGHRYDTNPVRVRFEDLTLARADPEGWIGRPSRGLRDRSTPVGSRGKAPAGGLGTESPRSWSIFIYPPLNSCSFLFLAASS